jgi:hypothetical protein
LEDHVASEWGRL